ncbi:Ig-like domain-containing protein [Roseateles aquatilis]|uniref:Ig-like domain-containing protein n=1 Tax=Roseateles aquatilis TaxID=431061 RepID=UPI001EE10365|nr:Ig-like domain-containing protein [Roseateles aquatilis]
MTNDSGSSNSDKVTNDAALSVSGLETGATWEYSSDGSRWTTGSGSSIPAGAFSGDGIKSIQVRQTDAAGNTSGASTFNFTLDTAAPAAPSVSLTNDSGSSNSDKVTNDATLGISGLETGATWEYSSDGSRWTTGSGSSIPASAFSGDGIKSIQVRQTDAAGNTSGASTFTFTLDSTAPAPTITVDDVTTDNTVSVSEAAQKVTITGGVAGDAKLNDEVTLTVGGKSYTGQVITKGNGLGYSIEVDGSDLAKDVSVNASVKSKDAAGNEGTSVIANKRYDVERLLDLNGAASGTTFQAGSVSLSTATRLFDQNLDLAHADVSASFKRVEVKLSGAAASNADQLLGGADSQSAAGLTGASLTVGGTTWTVTRDGTSYVFTPLGSVGNATAAQVETLLKSLWTRNDSVIPLQGERRFDVTVTDNQDRNTSAYATLSLDNGAPVVDLNGRAAGVGYAFATTPGLSNAVAIASQSQATVQESSMIARLNVKAQSGVTGALSATGANQGEWLGLSDGTDADGMSASLRIGAAASLTNSLLIPGKTLTLSMAADGTLTISAQDGLTQEQASQVLQALRYTADGSVVAGQRSLFITATDLAGNTSASAVSTLTVNVAGTPTISLDASSDTGLYSSDGVTSRNGSVAKALTFNGTAAAGASVTVFNDANGNGVVDSGESLGSATANASGNWSLTLNSTTTTLVDGNYRIAAKTGTSAAAAVNVTVDTQAPASTFSMGDAVQLHPLLAGTTDPNARVTVGLDTDGNLTNGYEVQYTTQSDSTGRWTLDTATAVPTQGSAPTFTAGAAVNAQVTTVDLAGNETTRTASSTAQSSLYSISDAQVIEGTTGTREMVFLVTRNGDLTQSGSVNYAVDNIASSAKSTGSGADNDYSGTVSGTVDFAAGETSKLVKFTVNGDNWREVNDKVVVNLSAPTNGSIADGLGIGVIGEIDVARLNAAYGLRDLNPNSNDYGIRVRRSSDNKEMDVGFDANGNLDTQALLDFVGRQATSKGYVTTWYDQSGHGRNMTQPDAAKQGVIVDAGQLVKRADGSVAISFNNGRNGANDDNMTAQGEAATDWKSAMIYAKVQSEGAAAGSLFNLGANNLGRLNGNYPLYDGVYGFDVNDTGANGRLVSPSGPSLSGRANDVVFEAHSGNSTAGTAANNYTDGAQVIYENGVRVASDATLAPSFGTQSTWTLASHGKTDSGSDGGYYQQVMFNEFLVYLAKDNSTPTIRNLRGTAGNDVLTYSGETGLSVIDGVSGNDMLYLSGAVNLDVTALAQGMRNIDQVWMANGQTNVLTLNDASIAANGASSLTVTMDAGDKVVFNGQSYSYGADQQTLIIGSSAGDVITSTGRNDVMLGGAGADTFTWLAGQTGHDTVQDYSAAQGDKLDLSKLLQGFTAGSESLFIHKVTDVSGQVSLQIDVHGKGDFVSPELTITLLNITATDPLTVVNGVGISSL